MHRKRKSRFKSLKEKNRNKFLKTTMKYQEQKHHDYSKQNSFCLQLIIDRLHSNFGNTVKKKKTLYRA